MGAKEICLTAHHEGGFCLWPTKYSNYSVLASPFKKDIVRMFVESCVKFGVKPCFYIGPNANGYLTQVAKYSPDEFIQAQMGTFVCVCVYVSVCMSLLSSVWEQKRGTEREGETERGRERAKCREYIFIHSHVSLCVILCILS